MAISEGKSRKQITLSDDLWTYLEGKVTERQRNWWGNRGQQTISKEIERLVTQEMELKKAGFEVK